MVESGLYDENNKSIGEAVVDTYADVNPTTMQVDAGEVDVIKQTEKVSPSPVVNKILIPDEDSVNRILLGPSSDGTFRGLRISLAGYDVDTATQDQLLLSTEDDVIYIADASITTAKIADLAVTNAKIANATIEGGKIANVTITNANIANTTITGAKIAASTITADKLSVTSLSAINANLGTVTAGSLDSVTVTAATITLDLGGTSTTGGKLMWGSNVNKIWVDSSADMGIRANGGEIYFYGGTNEVAVFTNAGQAVFRYGITTEGNFNVTSPGTASIAGTLSLGGVLDMNDFRIGEVGGLTFNNTDPSTNSTLYRQSNLLKFRDSGGTIYNIDMTAA